MFSTIGLIVDIVIVLTILIFGLIGFKKGLLKSVISLFSWGVCLIVAFFTAKYVAGWINGLYDFSTLIGNKISNNLVKMNQYFAQSINVYEAGGKDALIAAIPGDINGLLKQLIKVVFSTTNVNMSTTDTIGSVVGYALGNISMMIISGILVFVVLKIVIKLLSKLFDNIERIKILGGLNKILGLTLGVIKSVLVIFVFNCILVGLSLVPAVNKTIKPIVHENTYVEKFVYTKTDDLFEKYVIKGKTIQTWVEDLWEKR